MNAPLPPHDRDAEAAVIGSMMIDPDVTHEIAAIIPAEAFYDRRHGFIFEAMLALVDRDEPIDFVLLAAELERRGRLEGVGGEAELIGYLSTVPTSVHARHYAEVVREAWTRRRLVNAAGKIATLAHDGETEIEDAIAAAESLLFSIAESGDGQGAGHIREAVRAYIDQAEDRRDREGQVFGVPTGFTDIDRLLGGMNNSDLLLLAGRPGMGKTAKALGIALNAALKHDKRVAIYSLEMSKAQLVERMLASETQINSQRLRRAEMVDGEWPLFYEAAGRLSELGVWINDDVNLTPSQIRAECRRLYAEHGLDLVVLDYVGLVESDTKTSNRVQHVSEVSRGLKKLARELNVPVLALSQLSRAVENRGDKRPILSDLRDSGSLEQDSDVVMFIYRDEYYNPDTTDRPNVAEIIVAKNRHGYTGIVDLYWSSQNVAFRDLSTKSTQLPKIKF